jgi:uncharacterized glyoxalase superfamily protein PhnB
MAEHEDLDQIDHDSAPPRYFFGAVPVFLVDDVLVTAEYYRETLGFELNFIWGEPPSYGSVSRDDAIINFSRSMPAGRRNGMAAAGAGNGVDVIIVVKSIDEVYEELRQRGATITMELETQVYAMREFQLRDNNGYILAIAEEIEAEP